MKIKVLISSSVIVSGLLSSIVFSKPTEEYPNNIALLKHEKGIHYKSAWRRSLWPYPVPFVINNAISGTYGWKKYNKANKMYKLYKSAELVVDTVDKDKDKDNKKYLKAYNRVHHFLLKLQEESREDAKSKNGIVDRKESQIKLDNRIQELTTEDLARLLSEANNTIPPTCGKPEAGVANFDGFNLRFKIRTVSLYKENTSMLEDEIELEKEKIASDEGQRGEDMEDMEPNPEPENEPIDADQAPAPEPEAGKEEPASEPGPINEESLPSAEDQKPDSELVQEEPNKNEEVSFEEEVKELAEELASQVE